MEQNPSDLDFHLQKAKYVLVSLTSKVAAMSPALQDSSAGRIGGGNVVLVPCVVCCLKHVARGQPGTTYIRKKPDPSRTSYSIAPVVQLAPCQEHRIAPSVWLGARQAAVLLPDTAHSLRGQCC